MPKETKETIEAEDDKRIIKTAPTVLSDKELKERFDEMGRLRVEKIYVGEKPADVETTRLGRIINQMLYIANTDEEMTDFLQRAHKQKAILLKIVDQDGETHGISARAGEITLYDGHIGYDVVCSMYEDTFLDIILSEIDINYAFAAGYIVFEGANWLLHSEVIRTMFTKFREAVDGKQIFTLIKQLRKS